MITDLSNCPCVARKIKILICYIQPDAVMIIYKLRIYVCIDNILNSILFFAHGWLKRAAQERQISSGHN